MSKFICWGKVAARKRLASLGGRDGFRLQMETFEHRAMLSAGDYNADGFLTASDIDVLSAAVRDGNRARIFDLNGDSRVNNGDRVFWVNRIKNTYFGDANLDGLFNSSDFVDVFQADEYEDRLANNSSWSEGDWNGDADFDSGDFITAFQSNGYEIAPIVQSLTVTIEPSENGGTVFLPLAARTSNHVRNGQLALKLFIRNNENHAVKVTNVKVATNLTSDSIPVDLNIGPNSSESWFFSREDIVVLPQSNASTLQVEVSCNGCDTASLFVTQPLSPHTSPVQGGSYAFPAKATDLRPGEFWSGASTTHAPAGDGGQLFAYDMNVIGWDSTTNSWSSRLPGTDGTKNEHSRIWGKPIYAMADGTVVAFDNNKPNNLKPGEDFSPPDPVEGNHFYLQHGDELMLYAHFQKGSLNPALMQIGKTVQAGQFLGLAGNSGNSSGPHLHIHAIQGTKPWQGATRPIPFNGIHVIDRDALPNGGPDGAWVAVNGQGLPNVRSAIWPSSSTPCTYAPGFAEIARHGIRNADYQAVFTSISECGYQPEWVDGYDVNGDTYFNVVFRPTSTPWVARHNLTGSQYQTEFNKWVGDEKYRLSHVDSYLLNGSTRYAAIFEKPRIAPLVTAYHGVTGSQHQASFNNLTRDGWVPKTISVVSVSGSERYTAIYEKKNVGSFVALSHLTSSQYQTEFNANAQAGRELSYVNGYVHDGTTYFSAIWYGNGSTPYVARHNLSSSQYQSEFNEHTSNGFLTRAVTGYAVGNQMRFAALWTR